MLRISINEYLTAWEINVDYAKTQLQRAIKKLDRIIRDAETIEIRQRHAARRKRIKMALAFLEGTK